MSFVETKADDAGKRAFMADYGHLFEHSEWIVERAWARRPFVGIDDLHAAFMATIAGASLAEKLALLRAHPELADKTAIAEGLTESSAAEQASAGLDRLTAEEYETFHQLNRAYGSRFGFPFMICVRLNDKASILAAIRRRLNSTPEEELDEAIAQIGLISRLRLAQVPTARVACFAALDARVRHDLATLNIPAADWVPQSGGADGPVHDVVIVGGGQSGLGVAFGLIREGVRNILVLDENPKGREGPWATYARMVTLRTPKSLTAIDFGIPSLTFRAWWEAQYGRTSWDALDKIAREDWMRYLEWYRETLDLPVRNDVRVTGVEPFTHGIHRIATIDGATGQETRLLARKIVFATGIQGGGEWHIPGFIRAALPPGRYAHSSSPIDFAPLKGKRIGILGGGASAFDNAQFALRAGVAEAHVFIRRAELPRINPIRHMEGSGLIRHFAMLDDAGKYRVVDHFLAHNQPPTNDTYNRAAALPGFSLHLGAQWESVAETPEGVAVHTAKGDFTFDYLIVSTGLRTHLALRPELTAIADDIALWRDRFAPDDGANPLIDDHPYLGPAFEFQGRTTEGAKRLYGLFAFNYSALASLGLSASALSGLGVALPKLVAGVTAQLFDDNRAPLLDAFLNYNEPEFVGQWPIA